MYDLSIITQWSYDLSRLFFILLNLYQAGSPAVNQAYAVLKVSFTKINWCTQSPQCLLSTFVSYLKFSLSFTIFENLTLILTNTHCEKTIEFVLLSPGRCPQNVISTFLKPNLMIESRMIHVGQRIHRTGFRDWNACKFVQSPFDS